MKDFVQSPFQRGTGHSLYLPHFIVLGAMKSGTTTLYRYCASHPDIDMSRDKETDFFLETHSKGRALRWYSNQFSRGDAVRGEASPNYSKSRDFPGVPERMASTLPDARLIYILRDPLIRAEAQFRHSVLHGALSQGLDGFGDSHEYQHILDTSRYALQLSRYWEHFPKDAVLLLDFDELVRDPQAVMDRVFRHVGVRPHRIETSRNMNNSAHLSRVPAPVLAFAQSRTGKMLSGFAGREVRDVLRAAMAFRRPRSVPTFPDDLKRSFRDDLAMDVARLRQMTGYAFSGWSI